MNSQNDTSLDIELRGLSEQIQQYLLGKSRDLESLSTDDTAINGKYIQVDATEWNYIPKPQPPQPETAYINARNIALEITQKYPGLPELPQLYESKPIIRLQGLLEWCIKAQKVMDEAAFLNQQDKFGFHPKRPTK